MKTAEEYREAIESYLLSRYGKIQDDWALVIDLLIDNVIKYQELQAIIDEYGMFNKEIWKINPAVSKQKDIQAAISKQIQSLGLSPYHSSKIKVIEADDQEKLLSELLGNDDD